MVANVNVGDSFPDLSLPDHENHARHLSDFTKPGLFDQQVGASAMATRLL